MKAYIIHGNMRSKSNTEELARLLADELEVKGVKTRHVMLREKDIRSCVGCDKCHSVLDSYGCVIDDDMQEIAKEIMDSDLVILTSPIYTWMPTAPQKAVMDRFYAFTKFTDTVEMFNLLKKQKIAMVATSGDDCEENCDLFDEATRRMATFAKLTYLGYLAARDYGDGKIIKPEVSREAAAFAIKCINAS